MCAKLLKSYLTLCNPMDCSPPASSVHEIFQARILAWVAISFSRGFSWPRDQTHVLCLLHWQAGSLPVVPPGKLPRGATAHVGDLGSIPGLGRSLGEGKGYPIHYSGLENSMDCIIHGVTKNWTRLSDFHFLFWKLPLPSKYFTMQCFYQKISNMHYI